jgi:hypothetical protein
MTGRLFTHLVGLTQTLGQRAILIVGGLRNSAKLRLIKERFDIDAEWHEIEAPIRGLDSVEQRIRSGRVGVVVLLEGLMGHKVSDRVIRACNQYNVPFAYGDRAGSGSLEHAFDDLERRVKDR